MYILGISAFYHDSAACLLRDGEIVAAAQEERFTRVKGDASFPTRAIASCLDTAGIRVRDLDHVGFYDKPLLKLERILETFLSVAPAGLRSFNVAGPLWAGEKLDTEGKIRRGLDYTGPILFAEHHESHAASAFYPSPFTDAAVLTMDGVGEWATATIATGHGHDLELLRELRWPDSLGLLYSAFTTYLGFTVNRDEYKVMGLAPYGRPAWERQILEHLVDLKADGSFRLDRRYFGYLSGLTMTTPAFHDLFGGAPRVPGEELTDRHRDVARSIQNVCEEIVLRMARTAHEATGAEDLCMAGGVALNCVANGRVLREGPFRRVWIQPAAGDAGGALGVAQLIWHRHLGNPKKASRGDAMHGAFLGPAHATREMEETLQALGATFERKEDAELLPAVAALLADGATVGWFDGRMEFGPRALGARSILADPRRPDMQAQLNRAIKFREEFRPFAPAVLRERVSKHFALDTDSPYMLLVAQATDRALPAVTHVDGSARIQTVDAGTNPRFHALLRAFEETTGTGVLVNTSFNTDNEPIVCTPADAYRCFMRSGLSHLVIGPFLLRKDHQPEFHPGHQTPHPAPRTLAGRIGAGSRHVAERISRVTNPVLLSVVYLGLVTPIGLALRMLGQDPLKARPQVSFWKVRPDGARRSNLARQF